MFIFAPVVNPTALIRLVEVPVVPSITESVPSEIFVFPCTVKSLPVAE